MPDKILCPYYKQQYAIDPKTGKGYEGVVWCTELDCPCMWEYEGACEEYNTFLKENEQ